MSTLNELASLPTPAIIDALSFDAIFAELQAEFQSRYPDYSALLASDPAIKLLEVAAYRETLLRARINDAARANLLAFATGSDLDHLAAFYGVTRLTKTAPTQPLVAAPQGGANFALGLPGGEVDEDDEALRLRTRQRIVGFANAGGAAHYRYWALSAAPEVADALVDSPEPGRVRISVLTTEQTVPEPVLDAVRAVVLRDDIRVLTDTVSVVSAELLPVEVTARLWLLPDAPSELFAAIRASFTAAMAASAGLGWDLTVSWVIAQLQQPGVHRVQLLSPQADTSAGPHQAVRLASLSLTLMGRDQ